MTWDEKIRVYDALVDKCSGFDRKGKSVPYTSANGYMFSFLNKDGELGIRFAKEIQEEYILKFKSDYFRSHNAIMKGYVLIPTSMLEDLENLSKYLNESYNYVMSLKPK